MEGKTITFIIRLEKVKLLQVLVGTATRGTIFVAQVAMGQGPQGAAWADVTSLSPSL